MKKQRELRRTPGLTVEKADIRGGYGRVEIGSWMGSVVWGADEQGWEHVSVSPFDRSVTPSWDDMCQLKDMFFEDEEMALQFHPKKSEYVNLMENCLHIWRPKDEALLAALERGRA